MKNMLMLKETFMTEIHDARVRIADLTKEKILVRAESWKDAEGIADQKKDYVRSMVADIQQEIDVLEADIEHYYNQIRILDEKIELEKLSNE